MHKEYVSRIYAKMAELAAFPARIWKRNVPALVVILGIFVKKRHAHLNHLKMAANVFQTDSAISLSAYARMGILVIRVKRKCVLS